MPLMFDILFINRFLWLLSNIKRTALTIQIAKIDRFYYLPHTILSIFLNIRASNSENRHMRTVLLLVYFRDKKTEARLPWWRSG